MLEDHHFGLRRTGRPPSGFLSTLTLCATVLVGGAPLARSQTFTRILDLDNPVVNDEAESGGACWIDLNDDDLLDLFVANGNLTNQNDALYRNTGAGFVKVLTGPVVNNGGSSIGGTLGDYDNDGRPDLFVTNRSDFGNFLYHGEGDTLFTAITTGEPVTDIANSNSSSWTDIDGDGLLDIYVVNFAGPDFLYQNDGPPSFTFTGIDTCAPQLGNANSIPGAWADYDNDRDQDLFIGIAGNANDRLYRNDGGLTFAQISFSDARSTLGASWGDFDNDGDLDLFTSIFLNQGNILYRNSGTPSYALSAVDTTVLPANAGNSVGSAWGDYDNDGDQDLFVANDGQNNMLFENGGPPAYTFTRIISGALVTDGGNSFGCVWGDYDADGDLDLFVANRLNQKNFLYRNEGNADHWLKVRLVGIESNRSGIGAKVRVKATIGGAPRWQIREVTGQTGYNSQNLELHFGLGDAAVAESVLVEWPSGEVDPFAGLGVDRLIRIVEATGATGVDPPRLGASGFEAIQVGYAPPVSVRLRLPEALPISIDVFDPTGRRLAAGSMGTLPAGTHLVPLTSTARAASGVYFCRLRAGRLERTLRILLVR